MFLRPAAGNTDPSLADWFGYCPDNDKGYYGPNYGSTEYISNLLQNWCILTRGT